MDRKIAASNLGTAVVAILTVLAVLVAPICAPLCAATACKAGDHAGRAGMHCREMAVNENGPSAGAGHRESCGSGELAATLNEATRRMDDDHDAQARIATGDLPGLAESWVSGTSGRYFRSDKPGIEPKQTSSSIVVLKT